MSHIVYCHAAYLDHPFSGRDKIVRQAKKHLNPDRFDTLVGRGMSGALVVPILAHALKKHFVIVRKPNDGSHSGYDVEGALGARWIFVDDLIDSGETFRTTKKAINKMAENYGADWDWRTGRFNQHTTRFVGAYLYNGSGRYAGARTKYLQGYEEE